MRPIPTLGPMGSPLDISPSSTKKLIVATISSPLQRPLLHPLLRLPMMILARLLGGSVVGRTGREPPAACLAIPALPQASGTASASLPPTPPPLLRPLPRPLHPLPYPLLRLPKMMLARLLGGSVVGRTGREPPAACPAIPALPQASGTASASPPASKHLARSMIPPAAVSRSRYHSWWSRDKRGGAWPQEHGVLHLITAVLAYVDICAVCLYAAT